jgi:hypothetical protein
MTDTCTHLLECQKGPWHTRRHNAVRDTWQTLIAAATGTMPLAEQAVPQTAVAPHGSQEHSRRADIVISTTGAPTYIDVVIPSPLAPTWFQRLRCAHTDGATAANAEKYKRAHYHPTPVVPLATEVFGRHGESSLEFLARLTHTARERGTTYEPRYAQQALALTLQRANAQNILHHMTPNANVGSSQQQQSQQQQHPHQQQPHPHTNPLDNAQQLNTSNPQPSTQPPNQGPQTAQANTQPPHHQQYTAANSNGSTAAHTNTQHPPHAPSTPTHPHTPTRKRDRDGPPPSPAG